MNIQSHVTILIYAYSRIVNCYIWINQTQLYQNNFNTSSNFLNSDNDIHYLGDDSCSFSGILLSFSIYTGTGGIFPSCNISDCEMCLGMLHTVCLSYSQSTKCNIGYFFDITRRICLGNKSSIEIILYTKI